MTELKPFAGGRRLMTGAGLAGAAGLALTLLLAFFEPQRTAYSYLVAFTYWAGIALGALIWLGTFHACRARWMTPLRRVLEAMSFSIALFLPLFVPIALALPKIFVWAAPAGTGGAELAEHLEKQRFYLNVPFFLVRTAAYFAIWIATAWFLQAWSRRQDRDGAPQYTVWQRKLGAGSLPALGLTMTFAAFDWLMSLAPQWRSTIFGVYYYAGSFLAALAVLTLCAAWARGPGLAGGLINENHFHSLGKLLLAFTVFWAYIAFSQYLLIWIANIPEEIPWYLVRGKTGWRAMGLAIAVGQFVLPFAVLLSADLKRDPRKLAAVSVWILIVHYFDLFWVALPRLTPAAPSFALSDLFAFVGIGGVAVAFVVWRLRGGFAVPVRDPYLAEGMAYEP